jgi:hypothetical protein
MSATPYDRDPNTLREKWENWHNTVKLPVKCIDNVGGYTFVADGLAIEEATGEPLVLYWYEVDPYNIVWATTLSHWVDANTGSTRAVYENLRGRSHNIKSLKVIVKNFTDTEMARTFGEPHRGSRWRHYKGDVYMVERIVIREETEEFLVIYTLVESSTKTEKQKETSERIISWARPLKDWRTPITLEGEGKTTVRRFTLIERD